MSGVTVSNGIVEVWVQWKDKGNASLKAGDLTQAIECYSNALYACTRDTDRAVCLSNRSAAFLQRGSIPSAIFDGQEAVRLASAYAKAYHRLGKAFQAQGESEEAQKWLSKAKEMDTSDTLSPVTSPQKSPKKAPAVTSPMKKDCLPPSAEESSSATSTLDSITEKDIANPFGDHDATVCAEWVAAMPPPMTPELCALFSKAVRLEITDTESALRQYEDGWRCMQAFVKRVPSVWPRLEPQLDCILARYTILKQGFSILGKSKSADASKPANTERTPPPKCTSTKTNPPCQPLNAEALQKTQSPPLSPCKSDEGMSPSPQKTSGPPPKFTSTQETKTYTDDPMKLEVLGSTSSQILEPVSSTCSTGSASGDSSVIIYDPSMEIPGCKSKEEAVIQSLKTRGYAVVDDYFPGVNVKEHLRKIRELEPLFRMSEIWVGKDGDVGAQITVPKVRGDKILWVNAENMHGVGFFTLEKILNRLDTLVYQHLKAAIPKLFRVASRTEAMLTIYPGTGGRFQRHVDNTISDGRVLTVVSYWNTKWDAVKDGGQLRLFPEGSAPIDIYPVCGRVAFFYSDEMAHAVMPAFKERHALTFWYYDSVQLAAAQRSCVVPEQDDAPRREAQQFIKELVAGEDDPSNPKYLKMLATRAKALSEPALGILTQIVGAPSPQHCLDALLRLTPQTILNLRERFNEMGL